MILSFKHKGLARFYDSGVKSGIRPEHADKLERILDRLDAAITPGDMNLPGYRLHKLTGNYKGYWSVIISGNYRVIFQFQGENAKNVDYLDYH